MPYEYRILSPEEREALVKYRATRGYPFHAPPHPFREAGVYLISAANFEHKAVMKPPDRRTEFEVLLLNTLKEIADEIVAWVILPNHYHFLAAVQSLDHISAGLKHLHGSTSRSWNLEDNLTGKRRVWYKFADTYIRNDQHLHAAFNYIHYNPVKHGYTIDQFEWPWSSLSSYCDDKGKDWLRDHWRAYTPSDDFGRGWDDDLTGND
jgi:putative transposase